MQKRGAQHLSSVEHLLPSVPDNTGRLWIVPSTHRYHAKAESWSDISSDRMNPLYHQLIFRQCVEKHERLLLLAPIWCTLRYTTMIPTWHEDRIVACKSIVRFDGAHSQYRNAIFCSGLPCQLVTWLYWAFDLLAIYDVRHYSNSMYLQRVMAFWSKVPPQHGNAHKDSKSSITCSNSAPVGNRMASWTSHSLNMAMPWCTTVTTVIFQWHRVQPAQKIF